MITNEERKQVAARLREKYCERQGMFEPQCLSTQALNTVEDLLDCMSVKRALLLDLADLIEPEPERTCELEPSIRGRRRCARCGAFVSDFAVFDCFGEFPAKYCPNCGAKVAKE